MKVLIVMLLLLALTVGLSAGLSGCVAGYPRYAPETCSTIEYPSGLLPKLECGS